MGRRLATHILRPHASTLEGWVLSPCVTNLRILSFYQIQKPLYNNKELQILYSAHTSEIAGTTGAYPKSIGNGSDSESVRRLWWMVFGVETGREIGRRGQNNQDRIC